MKPALIYLYDAYCGWCYGFSPVLLKTAQEYRHSLPLEVLSGGMILPDKPAPLNLIAPYLQNQHPVIEQTTGISFGEDYLWHIFHPDESDWFPHSEKPAVALCIFRDYRPDLQAEFVTDIQYGFHFEGRDPTDGESYRHLLEKYAIPEQEFYTKFHDPEYKKQAYEEFDLVKRLGVSSFPAVLVQASESKSYQVANGYTDYATLKKNIDSAIYSITIASSS